MIISLSPCIIKYVLQFAVRYFFTIRKLEDLSLLRRLSGPF